MRTKISVFALILVLALIAKAQAGEIDWAKVDAALGKTASVQGEVHRYGIPRSDLQVTVDGVTRPLPAPFFVIATENPIEQDGTFPLPEAQLDRFLIRTSLGYPGLDEEIRIVEGQVHGHPLDSLPGTLES